MKIKYGLLKPLEICEYANSCEHTCNGKNEQRDCTFSCGLRRGLLMVDGFSVKFETVINKIAQ
jgi:hypothetical protein